MANIAIMTDSDSSIPADVAERLDIAQAPISIQFGEESYDAGVTIDDKALFERVDRLGKLPTTAAPTPGKYADAFQKALDSGAESVICITVSSKISASYQAAGAARDLFPDRDITIVDSNSLSMGQGFMTIAAREAVLQGATKGEAIAAALDVGKRTHLFAALSTLKYLAMSGRVGYLAAGMATILAVKPILTIKDGKLEVLERVRTRSKALSRVVECAAQAAGGKPIERMALIHVNAIDDARELHKMLCASLPCPESVTYAELTPGLSAQACAGVAGVVIVTAR